MALEDVAHGLGTDRQAQVGQGADDAVIAPGTILPRHADNQRLQLRVDGSSWRLCCWEPSNFWASSAVPAKNRVGLNNRGHVL